MAHQNILSSITYFGFHLSTMETFWKIAAIVVLNLGELTNCNLNELACFLMSCFSTLNSCVVYTYMLELYIFIERYLDGSS